MKQIRFISKKIILIFCILLLLIVEVSASGAAAAAGAATVISAARDEEDVMQKRQESSCALPLDFAKEHDCALYYPDRYDKRVGSFICKTNDYEQYDIIADCKGGVINYIKKSSLISPISSFFPLIIILSVLFIVMYFIFSGFGGL